MYYPPMKNQLHCYATSKTKKPAGQILYRVCFLLLCLPAVLLTGCSTTKPKSQVKPETEEIHQRGWIGGKFKLARKTTAGDLFFGSRDEFISTFPRGLASSNRAGILITALSSNTPARQAGLRQGDLILACNHQPVTTVKAFFQLIDRTEPGASLPIAAWREGQIFECNVSVGRETFRNWGIFSVGFALPHLPELGPRDLIPTPGFNLI